MLKSRHTIALDKTCELADTSASVYADLAELADNDIAEKLSRCAEARAQAANDLIVARQSSGDLPTIGKPEKAALQALGIKLSSLVSDTHAMAHNLRDMDLEVREAALSALEDEPDADLVKALHAVIQSVEEAAATLYDL